MRAGTLLAILVFIIVAVAHFLRLVYDINVTVGDWSAPAWVSIVGVIVPATIAWMLWREM